MSQAIQRITLGFAGASGVRYGVRLLEQLLLANKTVHLLVSKAALAVFRLEEGWHLPDDIEGLTAFFREKTTQQGQLRLFSERQWTAPMASGSNVSDAMVVCPCSSSTLSAIAQGLSDNLLERAADVSIKERNPLILVHRETPLSAIHLENMLKLTRMGAIILPASPGFYHKPTCIDDLVDFIVARVLDQLQIEHQLMPRWGADI